MRLRNCLMGAALLFASASLPAADTGKLAFVKDGELRVWSEASKQSVIVARALPAETLPQWSPDGQSILYWSATAGKYGIKSVRVRIFGFPSAMPGPSFDIDFEGDQTLHYAGVREIKKVGWYGSGQIYIIGNISPSNDEMRLFNLADHAELPGFVGYAFAVCRTAPTTYFYQNSQQRAGYELVRDGVPVTAPGLGPLRLIVADRTCANWYGLETNSDKSVLRRIGGTKAGESVATLPHVDYLRIEFWSGNVVLFRPTGEFVSINSLGARNADGTARGVEPLVSDRIRQAGPFGQAYDWFP
jgi:hypothetical protein